MALAPDTGIILAAVLLGLTILLMRWPEFGTLLATALLYLNLHSIAMRTYDVPSIVLATTTVLVLPALLKNWVVDRKGLIIDRPFLLMLAFLASTILSAFFAQDTWLALDWLVRYVIEAILLYFLLINLVRTKRSLRRIIWTIVLCGGFLAGLTVYQELTGSYTTEFGGLARRNLRWESQRDLIQEGNDRTNRPTIRTAHRAYGPSLDPNRYAQLLIVLLPLGWFLFKDARTVVWRSVAVGCSSLILAGVLLTYSRGAFVGLLVIVCLMVVLRLATLWEGLIGAGAIVLCVTVLSPGYAARMVSIRGSEALLIRTAEPAATSDSSERLRAALMRAAWKVFLERPILGVGPGQFADVYSINYSGEFYSLGRVIKEQRAHSLYVELAAETGSVGLCIFLGIVAMTLRRLAGARRCARGIDPFVANCAGAFVVAIAAYLTTGLFLHLAYQRYYWLLLALGGVIVSVRPGTGREGPASRVARLSAAR